MFKTKGDSIVKKMEIKESLEDLTVVQKFNWYNEQSAEEKQKVWDDWNLYFDKVKETKAYRRFLAQKKALLEDKLFLVKEFSDKATLQRFDNKWELDKPIFIDPMVFEYSPAINLYKKICHELNPKKDEEFKEGIF